MSAVSAREQGDGELLWGVWGPFSLGLSFLRSYREVADAHLFCLWNPAHAVITNQEFSPISVAG